MKPEVVSLEYAVGERRLYIRSYVKGEAYEIMCDADYYFLGEMTAWFKDIVRRIRDERHETGGQ